MATCYQHVSPKQEWNKKCLQQNGAHRHTFFTGNTVLNIQWLGLCFMRKIWKKNVLDQPRLPIYLTLANLCFITSYLTLAAHT